VKSKEKHEVKDKNLLNIRPAETKKDIMALKNYTSEIHAGEIRGNQEMEDHA
jgi:hypothetical protein